MLLSRYAYALHRRSPFLWQARDTAFNGSHPPGGFLFADTALSADQIQWSTLYCGDFRRIGIVKQCLDTLGADINTEIHSQ